MKIAVMTDMEGVAGIFNSEDWCKPGGLYYEKGKRLLTEEVNAAVEGFFAGGVSEAVVIDGHGAGGLDPELLDERALLLRGHYPQIWPWGVDESFNGLAFIGQHARAGTDYSHLTHTQGFSYLDLSVNGVSIGEYGQLALCAAELGVPTFFASGEEAFCREAEALTPGVFTVSTKQGLLPDGLDELDAGAYARAKLGALHRSPKAVRREIRERAGAAAKQLHGDPSVFTYPRMEPPYKLVLRLRAQGEEPARTRVAEHPESFIGVMNAPTEIVETA